MARTCRGIIAAMLRGTLDALDQQATWVRNQPLMMMTDDDDDDGMRSCVYIIIL